MGLPLLGYFSSTKSMFKGVELGLLNQALPCTSKCQTMSYLLIGGRCSIIKILEVSCKYFFLDQTIQSFHFLVIPQSIIQN